MRYYIAYGSNLNKKQMAFRCPDATPVGTASISNYEIVFRGHPDRAVATIEPKKGSSVPVAIWKISKEDERCLDAYEGFPRFYDKKLFKVDLNGKKVLAMAYIMTPGKNKGKPSDQYFATILQGYSDFALNPSLIMEHIRASCNDIKHTT